MSLNSEKKISRLQFNGERDKFLLPLIGINNQDGEGVILNISARLFARL